MFEGAFQLQTAAAYEFQVVAKQAKGGGVVDRGSGLVDALLVHQDAAGEDEGVGSLAGLGERTVYEELVEAGLQGSSQFSVISFQLYSMVSSSWELRTNP